MYRKAISKLIAIELWSAIMNFIIHTHLSIFKKNLRVLKQFISYLMKKLRHYIRSRIWKKIFHKIKVKIWLLWYFKTKIIVPNRVLYVVFTKRFLRLRKELCEKFCGQYKIHVSLITQNLIDDVFILWSKEIFVSCIYMW